MKKRSEKLKRTSLIISLLAAGGCLLFGCGRQGVDEETLERYIAAKSIYIEGDLEKAEEMFRKIVLANPRFYQARFMRAKTVFYLGDHDEAAVLLADILKDEPSYREAEHLYIRVLIGRGELEDASRRLAALLAYDADDPRLHYLQAMTYQANEDIASSLESLHRAALYGEEFSRVYLDLGRIYYIHNADAPALSNIDTCLALLSEKSPLRGPVRKLREKIADRDKTR